MAACPGSPDVGRVDVVEALDTIVRAPLGLSEWERLPERNTPFEVVDGQTVVTASPVLLHQVVVTRLAHRLGDAIPAGHEVLVSPMDWLIRPDPLLVRQPDLVVVREQQLTGKYLTEPPLLAVEVLSPHNRETDLVRKRRDYLEGGLEWYWIVDPDQPRTVVLRNTGDRFEPVADVVGDEELGLDEPFAVTVRPSDLIPDR